MDLILNVKFFITFISFIFWVEFHLFILYSICKSFIKNCSLYIYEGYWSIDFFYCNLFEFSIMVMQASQYEWRVRFLEKFCIELIFFHLKYFVQFTSEVIHRVFFKIRLLTTNSIYLIHIWLFRLFLSEIWLCLISNLSISYNFQIYWHNVVKILYYYS